MEKIFLSIAILALAIGLAFVVKSLSALNNRLSKFETSSLFCEHKLSSCRSDLDHIFKRLDYFNNCISLVLGCSDLSFKDRTKTEDLFSSEVCNTRFIHIDPIYEIDLRDFNAGDKIEFEEGSFGRIKIITKHVNYDKK